MSDSETCDEILYSYNEYEVITKDLMEKISHVLLDKPLIPCLQALLQMATVSFIYHNVSLEKLHIGIDVYYECFMKEAVDKETEK